VFVTDIPFQPDVIVAGKAKSLPKRGVPERCST
jgi:hypothetical protein